MSAATLTSDDVSLLVMWLIPDADMPCCLVCHVTYLVATTQTNSIAGVLTVLSCLYNPVKKDKMLLELEWASLDQFHNQMHAYIMEVNSLCS